VSCREIRKALKYVKLVYFTRHTFLAAVSVAGSPTIPVKHIFLENLIVPHFNQKNSPLSMKNLSSLPYLKQPFIDPCPQPDFSNSLPPILYL
jgi:hypothetical protein